MGKKEMLISLGAVAGVLIVGGIVIVVKKKKSKKKDEVNLAQGGNEDE